MDCSYNYQKYSCIKVVTTNNFNNNTQFHSWLHLLAVQIHHEYKVEPQIQKKLTGTCMHGALASGAVLYAGAAVEIRDPATAASLQDLDIRMLRSTVKRALTCEPARDP